MECRIAFVQRSLENFPYINIKYIFFLILVPYLFGKMGKRNKFTDIKIVIKNNHQLIEYYCGILELDYQLYDSGYLFDHEYVSAKRTSDKIF